jgi:hypothetical protein
MATAINVVIVVLFWLAVIGLVWKSAKALAGKIRRH